MEEKLEAVDCMVLNCVLDVRVRNEDIDDIMVSALEGGINYWCRKAEVKGDYLGEYASDQISRGGELILNDAGENKSYILSKKKFMEGLKKYITAGNTGCIDRETNRFGIHRNGEEIGGRHEQKYCYGVQRDMFLLWPTGRGGASSYFRNSRKGTKRKRWIESSHMQ